MSVNVKAELEKQAATQNSPVKLTKNMTIADMLKALEPEIRKALPAVITPPLSFVAALRYAPVSSDFQRALLTDETIKRELSVDMSEIQNQYLPDQKIPA